MGFVGMCHPIRLRSCKSFGKLFLSNVSYNMSEKPTENKIKPLVIMLPWLGATEKATKKYSDLYESLGCKVLVRESEIMEFLWPRKGLKNCQKFLGTIEDNFQPILIHSMSIGCYFYALMLMAMENEPEKYEKVLRNIKFQVIDSPVVGTLNEMAFGVSSMVSNNSALQVLIKTGILAYFAVSKPFTVDYYNKTIELIKQRSPIVPSLLMTSENDPMALPEAFESFCKAWIERGCSATSKVWTNSEHAKHFMNHPESYKALITELLKSWPPRISSKL